MARPLRRVGDHRNLLKLAEEIQTNITKARPLQPDHRTPHIDEAKKLTDELIRLIKRRR